MIRFYMMLIVFIIIIFILFCLLFVKKLYKRANIWTITLFDFDAISNFKPQKSNKIKIFSPVKNIRTTYHYCTGYADPFLFVNGDWLYLFFEEELLEAPAKIRAKRTKDLKYWEDLGVVLKEKFHLSYPFVFEVDGTIFMLPETYQDNSVNLYKAIDFPHKWRKMTLLKGDCYVDSSVIFHNGLWFLFTTVWEELKLFYSEELFSDDWKEHPLSPIDSITKTSRCGGAILEIDDRLYRFAQDCSNYYGENVGLIGIKELSTEKYEEEYIRPLINKSNKWSRYGGHHFNMVDFNGQKIAAMDGIVCDNFINNITRKFFNYKTIKKRTKNENTFLL